MARHALLIGVQEYDGSGNMTPLSCPRADVDLMQSLLTDPAFTEEPYAVTAVKDAELRETKQAVDDFVEAVDRDDTVIIYFSGHGMRDNASGDLYLCVRDTREDRLHSTGYPFTLLSRSIKNRNLRKVLIILDCCYSGAADVKDFLIGKLNEAEEQRENGTGTYVISSGGQTETSLEDKNKDYSLFTKVLAEGIRTGDADRNGNGVICVHEIARYVATKVPERAAQQGIETTGRAKRQQPQISSKADFGEFVIAVNAAKAAEEKRKKDTQAAREWMEAGRQRLRLAFTNNDVELDFLSDVETWIKAQEQRDAIDPTLPQIAALRDYGREAIGLQPFDRQWHTAQSSPIEAPVAAPAPDPVVPPQALAQPAATVPPQTMASKSPDGGAGLDGLSGAPVGTPFEDTDAPIKAGLDRLLGAYKNGRVAEYDYLCVKRWAMGGGGGDFDETRRQALIDYGTKSITLKTFNARWNANEDAGTPDLEAAASSDDLSVRAGLTRLREAHRNDEVPRSFVYAVEQWLARVGEDGDTTGHDLLRAYGAGDLDASALANSLSMILVNEVTTNARPAVAAPGTDYGWIVATIVGIAGLALALFLAHLALVWLIGAVPPVDWSSRYAVWPPGFKMLVVAGFLAASLGLLYAIFSALFDYDADLALGTVVFTFALLAGAYLFFYASMPLLVELDAFFLRIMGAYDWVVGLFLPQQAPGTAAN
jgi:uncharacterized caspase-like protein